VQRSCPKGEAEGLCRVASRPLSPLLASSANRQECADMRPEPQNINDGIADCAQTARRDCQVRSERVQIAQQARRRFRIFSLLLSKADRWPGDAPIGWQGAERIAVRRSQRRARYRMYEQRHR